MSLHKAEKKEIFPFPLHFSLLTLDLIRSGVDAGKLKTILTSAQHRLTWLLSFVENSQKSVENSSFLWKTAG